jgi:hypothetical protein
MKMLSYHLKIDRCYIDERANSILEVFVVQRAETW